VSRCDEPAGLGEILHAGALDPVDTRNALGMAIVASLNAPFGDDVGYGVLRL